MHHDFCVMKIAKRDRERVAYVYMYICVYNYTRMNRFAHVCAYVSTCMCANALADIHEINPIYDGARSFSWSFGESPDRI